MILKKRCPVCEQAVGAIAPTTTEIFGVVYTTYECGHKEFGVPLSAAALSLTSQAGEKSFKYQNEGAEFVVRANCRALIADEQGLGKTIQFLEVLKSHENDLTKFLIICKTTLQMQWIKQTMHWLGDSWMPQLIVGEQDFILPVKGFIVSIDLLRRFKAPTEWADRLGIKCVCIDEVQAIKNHDSKRTNAVRRVVKDVDHVIGLSGTPIKNHAGEYFPILNILHPERFPSLNQFLMNDVDTYFDGNRRRMGGLADPKRFQEKTKDFIIRRTRDDVSDEIALACGNHPFRKFLFSDLGEEVEQMYKASFRKFQDFMSDSSELSALERSSNILAYLSKMRHIAGIAKIDPCVDFIEDFIVETDRKIVIFLHHKDVAESMRMKLEQRRSQLATEWGDSIAQIQGGVSPILNQSETELFRGDRCRICIASTLAAGEGLNLQFCSDCVMLERQWNPANEEQAEARFLRIGQLAGRVNVTYLVAVATVDEFFSELVERKRAVIGQTLDGKELKWDESSLIRELTEVLLSQGGRRWGW